MQIPSIKDLAEAFKRFQIPKDELVGKWRKLIEDAIPHIPEWKWVDPKPGSNIMAVPDIEDHSNETREQYEARHKAKVERREKMVADELEKLTAKKKEDAKEKHWTDKLKPWPGAVGSLGELKI